MNEELNSEAKLNKFNMQSYTIATSKWSQNNFSDLVPSFVTVESVLNTGHYSFYQINPMTASYYTGNAVVSNPSWNSSLKRPD